MKTVWQIIRYFGLRWVAFRVRHGWRLRSGYFVRRAPGREWNEISWLDCCADEVLINPETYLERRRGTAPPFLFSASEFPGWREPLLEFDKVGGGLNPIEQADRISNGTFPHYSAHWLERGSAPDWQVNPFTGEKGEACVHWSYIRDDGLGDIKHIWELSRFAWVYPLVRAYARDGDERHAETFWRLLEDWLDKNPPNRGVNWMCGQEASIRVMAWCVGLYGFIDTKATTPERMQRLAIAMGESGRRIEANLTYALSQKNNHGITECTGLITIGQLFPEIRNAGRWQTNGLRHLERQVKELFYPDGAFSQHSSNYSRLAIQALIWVHQLMAKNRFESVGWLRSAIARGSRFLFEIYQPGTGAVPNSGGNDGALLMPLSNCNYADFRPVIQSGMLCGGANTSPFAGGPWDEELIWLGLEKPVDLAGAISPSSEFDAPEGGVFTLRQGNWTILAHAPAFRHRPAHADLLHVDLWWKEKPVAVDAGTYAYRAGQPFDEAFKTTRFHNTLEVDGISQMEPAGRFMLLPWAKARLVERGKGKDNDYLWMLLESNAYHRLEDPVTHQRAVIVGKSFVVVADWLRGKQEHAYRLQWLLVEKTPLVILANGKVIEPDTVTGDDRSARGWWSPHYMEKKPAASVVSELEAREAVFFSVFAGEPVEVEFDEGGRQVVIGGVRVDLEGISKENRKAGMDGRL